MLNVWDIDPIFLLFGREFFCFLLVFIEKELEYNIFFAKLFDPKDPSQAAVQLKVNQNKNI